MSSTIDQVFQARGLWRWFDSVVTNDYDGRSEKGQDYSTKFGTPVAVPVGGKIVRMVNNPNAINWIVELQAADGSVWLYQHITATVKVGQILQCGDVVGTENGLPVDQYSTGPHIEVRYCLPGTWNPKKDSWIEPWVNPRAIFASIGGQQAGTTGPGNLLFSGSPGSSSGTPGQGSSTNSGPSFTLPTLGLKPNAGVFALLQSLDTACDVVNPFNVVGAQQDDILGATFTDPFSWIEIFGENLAADLRGLILRLLLIALGVFIIWRLVKDFIDLGALTQNMQQLGQQATGAATGAAAALLA